MTLKYDVIILRVEHIPGRPLKNYNSKTIEICQNDHLVIYIQVCAGNAPLIFNTHLWNTLYIYLSSCFIHVCVCVLS